jgi:pimeloyl-ACP methyl ester carboxylesterase
MGTCYVGLNKISLIQNNKVNGAIPILLIHGAGASGGVWEHITYSKFDGFYQIVIDLPGHGKSPGDGFRTIEGYADFIDSVVTELGLENFILTGHSMGGAISLQYALNFPNKLRGIILLSAGAQFIIPDELLKIAKNDGTLYEYTYSKVTPLDTIKQAERENYKSNCIVRYNDLLACNHFNITSKLNRISVDTCIICGDNDLIVPPKYSQYLHKNIKDSQLHLIKNAGHMVLWEQPDRVCQQMCDFLKTL